jgi:hypothetical protein
MFWQMMDNLKGFGLCIRKDSIHESICQKTNALMHIDRLEGDDVS